MALEVRTTQLAIAQVARALERDLVTLRGVLQQERLPWLWHHLAMKSHQRLRALAHAMNFGLGLCLAGFSLEARAVAMQDSEDKEPPEVSIVSPKDGAEAPLGESLYVRVKATDNVAIKKVHLHMNGTDVGSIDGSADVIYSFQVQDIQKGEYTIKAVVYDRAGNSATSDEITVTGVEGMPKQEAKDGGPVEEGGRKSEEGKSGEEGGRKSEEDKSGDEDGDKEWGKGGDKARDKGGDKARDEGGDRDGDKKRGDKGHRDEGDNKSASEGEGSGENKASPDEKNDAKLRQKPEFGSEASGKAASTQPGENGDTASKGCNQGSNSLPLGAGLALVVLGTVWRRRPV